jgi:hypothetical protein
MGTIRGKHIAMNICRTFIFWTFFATCMSITAFCGNFVSQVEPTLQNYCPANRSVSQTQDLFMRTLAIGASYTHGCGGCETTPQFNRFLKEQGDFGWARRSLFVQNAQNLVGTETPLNWLITENDVKVNFGNIVHESVFQNEGYSGNWILDGKKDSMRLATNSEVHNLNQTKGFVNESSWVSAGEIRKTKTDRNKFRGGILYQSVPSTQFPKSFKVLDWSVDKSRSFQLFKSFGNETVFNRLMRSGWKDESLRAQLIDDTVRKIKRFRPTSVFGVDLLFWDTVPEMFYKAAQSELRTWPGRLVANRLMTYAIQLGWLKPEMKARVMHDLMRTLELVATSDHRGPAVPVFLGKLIANPAETISELNLEREYGNLIGTLAESFIGVDLKQNITQALEQGLPGSNTDTTEEFLPIDSKLPPEFQGLFGNIAGIVLKTSLPDLAKLLVAAEQSFAEQNKLFETYFEKTNADVHLLNLDDFFKNLHKYVNPQLVHPGVHGAKQMAKYLPKALCQTNH